MKIRFIDNLAILLLIILASCHTYSMFCEIYENNFPMAICYGISITIILCCLYVIKWEYIKYVMDLLDKVYDDRKHIAGIERQYD